MDPRRINSERTARFLAFVIILGLVVAVILMRWNGLSNHIEIHATMPETGGWSPDAISARVGEPLTLRLTSDDVIHGFAIGKMDGTEVEVMPGEVTEITLIFDQPGTYTYYCTRWCGPNHWRMRGTIEVEGESSGHEMPIGQPLYISLGLDIDAQHPAAVLPSIRPSSIGGKKWMGGLSSKFLSWDYYVSHSPSEVWQELSEVPSLTSLSDDEVWDLVAYIWKTNTSSQDLQEGQELYAANCAACHGVSGEGDGVFAELPGEEHIQDEITYGGHLELPTDFTDATLMLGASPALLQGKIIRGGMGTGMPYWGPIFTEKQTWALVSYLWSFQFNFSNP